MKERLDHFMARANAAYYATQDPFADFTTAPEISQVFGELLGLWAAVTWRSLGAQSPSRSSRWAGPRHTHDGCVTGDRSRRSGLSRGGDRFTLIETSPRLRAVQRERIGDAVWHDAI